MVAGEFVPTDVLLRSNAFDYRLRPSLCRGGVCRMGCDCRFSARLGHARARGGARAYNFFYYY
jgi:hypothetical protein